MDNFNYYNKEYLLSLKPRYYLWVYLIFAAVVIIVCLLFMFKTYDVYNFKGYIECENDCNIKLVVDINNTNKTTNIDFLKVNNNTIYPKNTTISDIQIDEVNNVNYQVVNYQVDQLDNGINKTIQDIRVYSNHDLIIKKIINFIM